MRRLFFPLLSLILLLSGWQAGLPGWLAPAADRLPAASQSRGPSQASGPSLAQQRATPALTEPADLNDTLVAPLLEFQPLQFARLLLIRLLLAALVLGVGWGLALLAYRITFHLLTRIHADVRYFMARLVYFTVWGVALLGVLSVFNVQVATVTAIVGTLGLALSLSSQDLLKNLIAGVYLLLEQPFKIGDQITITPYSGRVAYIDLRTTKLITTDGQEVIVPNTLVLSQVVVRVTTPPAGG